MSEGTGWDADDRYPARCSKLMNVQVGEKSIMQFRNMIKEISPFCTHYIPIFIDSHFYSLDDDLQPYDHRYVHAGRLRAGGLKRRHHHYVALAQVKTRAVALQANVNNERNSEKRGHFLYLLFVHFLPMEKLGGEL